MAECTSRWFFYNGTASQTDGFDESLLLTPGYIYEVFRVIEGIPLFLEDHIDRLVNSFALHGMAMPFSTGAIFDQVAELISVNSLVVGNIKIAYVPSTGSAHNHFMVYVTPHAYPDDTQYRDGVEVVLYDGCRENPNAKAMDVLLRQHTNQIKTQEGVYETLLVDGDHCITEGSRSNIFFVFDDQVITPVTADVLPGITRKHIIGCCREQGIPLFEQKVSVAALPLASAAFLSGTSRKVLPVSRINKHNFRTDHPIVIQVMKAFNDRVESYLRARECAM